ncbi:hypothetical protein [Helicobacter pylori]|uniref:hypothetical protein n=1 Tax=Helicobacter pylori TaxID=210 RepID=UPI00165B6615|nr:hypothetical protein [Helicobacter pylori]
MNTKKLLLILLLFTQSLMATKKDRTNPFGVMVATCGICEKRHKELEEQEVMHHYHSHVIIHRKEQR